jgi:hypothetical protein
MAALGRTVQQVLQAFGITLPPWLLPVAIVIAFVALSPLIKRNLNTDKARGVFRQSVRITGEEREKLQEQAIDMVKDNPNGLVAMVEEGLTRGQKDFSRKALDRLRATGKMPNKVRVLTRLVEGDRPKIPEAEVLAVRRFLDAGLVVKARERIVPALEEWPDNEDLQQLDHQIADRERNSDPIA